MAIKKTTKRKQPNAGLIGNLFSIDETIDRFLYEAETRLVGLIGDTEARIKHILDNYEVRVTFERKK